MRRITLTIATATLLGLGAAAPVWAGADSDKRTAGHHGAEQHYDHSKHKHHGKHQHHGKRQLKKMTEVLALTEAQQAQLAALERPRMGKRERPAPLPDANDPGFEAAVQDAAEQAAERARERVLAMAEYKQQVAAILTPEQTAKWSEWQAERKARWQERRATKLEQRQQQQQSTQAGE